MNIYTLTLNPAFDVHAHAEAFALHRESVAAVLSRDAGGKGVNISRALAALGVESEAFVVLGKENGKEFSEMLLCDGVKHTPFAVEGRIRENITLHVPGEKETRLSFRGFSASDSVLDEIEKALLDRITPGDAVTFTGSVPDGITHARVMTFLSRIKARGAQLVLDSKSLSREDVLSLRPALIKPNEEEVFAYIGKTPDTLEGCAAGARELSLSGIASVMVSFGGEGAILGASGHLFYARPPKITPLSTVGAGDASIAGFLYAAMHDEGADACLRYAVALGTAACLTTGTRPPERETFERILSQVEVREKQLK